MSESVQCQTPTRGLLTVTMYCRKRKTDMFLSRFLNVDGVSAVRMSRGKLL